MQRITNCVLTNGEQALLLQKPSRGWWVAPGGKMEFGETIKESAEREFREETGLHVEGAKLRAVFTIVVLENDQPVNEWMMFTFHATSYKGTMFAQSPEGKLEWKNIKDVSGLPMAEGDKYMFDHILNDKDGVLHGTFYYTKDFQLVSSRLTLE
ncbi:8-oxo-dGTP diphosphatase [Alkalihalobacillus sp. MEB130]|uniref:8-oxo-dGTP diphosphatase n=1 Tax=Alkalihalobacillus sp. MEB130 TaxID=2976704 RepID=UPI0028DE0ABF|nr:8-oxo-dGTP diphosphatase [Alkalihalobacillus sp. MEB130]MDT8858726.1 8-oxo-dGTP diphosphatase [Alkalihalobacillus sp. MEB130]